MSKKHQPPDELEAFCHSCPEPQEVTTFLKSVGLRPDFQMEAFAPPMYSELSALPAQFHFADASGMSLIYLAGQDSPTEDGVRFPAHKSRFWAYVGADSEHFARITHLVARQWSFTWHSPALLQQEVA